MTEGRGRILTYVDRDGVLQMIGDICERCAEEFLEETGTKEEDDV